MKKYIAIAAILILVGCQSFYSSVVTVTDIHKSVLNELGVLYREGKISNELDMRIEMTDVSFRLGCKSLEASLKAYKAGTSTNDPALKLDMVKQPVHDLIDILAPFVVKTISNQHYNDLNKATKL